MNASLSPFTLRQMGDANDRLPVSLREDPACFEPEDAALPFDSDWADAWIRGLASYADPEMYLSRDGIELGPQADEIAPLLKEMAIAYRDKPGALGDLIGGRYFQTMKTFASIAYNNQ